MLEAIAMWLQMICVGGRSYAVANDPYRFCLGEQQLWFRTIYLGFILYRPVHADPSLDQFLKPWFEARRTQPC